MRASVCASLCCMTLASIQISCAADVGDTTPTRSIQKQLDDGGPELLPPGDKQAVDSTETAQRDLSRYSRHDGQWWYQLANGRWLVWTGDRWRSTPTPPQSSNSAPSRRQWAGYRSPDNLPPSLRPTNHGWVGGFYSSGGGYGSADFGYGYGIPSYGPYRRP
jgi:hypothetical protein